MNYKIRKKNKLFYPIKKRMCENNGEKVRYFVQDYDVNNSIVKLKQTPLILEFLEVLSTSVY